MESSQVSGPNNIDGSNAYYATTKSAKEIVADCAGSGGTQTTVFVTGTNISACQVPNSQGGSVWLTNHDFGGFGDIQSVKFTAVSSNLVTECHLLNIIPASASRPVKQTDKVSGTPLHRW